MCWSDVLFLMLVTYVSDVSFEVNRSLDRNCISDVIALFFINYFEDGLT